MPWILALLLRGLLYLTGSFVGRVMVALGLGVVSYTGMSASLAWLKGQALQNIAASQWVGLLSYMKVGVFISIVFSAMLARAAINGLNSDTVKRLVLK